MSRQSEARLDNSAARPQAAVSVVEVMDRQTDLFEMIGALRAPCRLARRLNRWQKQRHQDPDEAMTTSSKM